MSARWFTRWGCLPRGMIAAAVCLGIGAFDSAGAATSFYHDGYARGRAGASPITPLLAQGGPSNDQTAGTTTLAPTAQRPSAAKSIGASLLIPGWGQHLTGHNGRATVFLTVEATLIATLVGFRVQGEVRQDRYSDYAELFAGVENARDKSDGYYRNLGRYMSAAEYEDDLARDARARFGDDIEQREAYVAERRPSDNEAWQWESEAHRDAFTEMRKDSRTSFHHADQVIGMILLNHVLSAVDAGRLSRKGASGRALYVSPGPDGTSYVGLSWPLDE